MLTRLCLNMIVKDEAHVIERCLASIRPYISSWVIVDTGSSDGTRETIRRVLADLPGQLFERPWRDFGHNRTEALELARRHGDADYIVVIDADEVWLPEPGFALPPLDADMYVIQHRSGDTSYTFYRSQIVRRELPCHYEGVLHEVLTCEVPHRLEALTGVCIRGFFDSARNRDPVAKYRRDAEVLERALEQDPENPRHVFYLAQSYRDAGELERSIETYQRRVALGGWAEEVWYALFQVGLLHGRLGHWERAVAGLLDAWAYRPERAEPLVSLAAAYRERGDWAPAHLFASRARLIPRPTDLLFLDEACYAWRALDELAIAAYWLGEHQAALDANDELLAGGTLPPEQRARVEENRQFCLAALRAGT